MCYYDDPSEANKWIKIKHGGQNNGIGTVEWNAQQNARFDEKVSGKSPRLFCYLDPPYYVKGKDLYLSFYKDDDHRLIHSTVSEVTDQHWVITYDNDPFAQSLYSDFRQIKFSLNYSASRAYNGSELAIFSQNIVIPNNSAFKTF